MFLWCGIIFFSSHSHSMSAKRSSVCRCVGFIIRTKWSASSFGVYALCTVHGCVWWNLHAPKNYMDTHINKYFIYNIYKWSKAKFKYSCGSVLLQYIDFHACECFLPEHLCVEWYYTRIYMDSRLEMNAICSITSSIVIYEHTFFYACDYECVCPWFLYAWIFGFSHTRQ